MNYTYVTTLCTENYLKGVLVLAESVKKYCRNEFVVLITDDLPTRCKEILRRNNIDYIEAPNVIPNELINDNIKNDAMFSHWGYTFFKLQVFSLTQYDKIVFLDSDMIIKENIDNLFEYPHMSATIAGKSYPGNESFDELNSGIFVAIPEERITEKLIETIPIVAQKKKVFGDQDVLNEYYSDWMSKKELHISENYNVFLMYYDYYKKHSVESIKVIHFIGKQKPWMLNGFSLFVEIIKKIIKLEFGAANELIKYKEFEKNIL